MEYNITSGRPAFAQAVAPISSFQLGEAPLLSAKGGYFFLARRYTMMRIKMDVYKRQVRYYLSLPLDRMPGERFVYDSACTYILAAIMEKVTGERCV